MLIAALAVPATTWWVSLRHYQAHQEKQKAVTTEQTWQHKYQEKRKRMLEDVREDASIEGVPEVRSTWNGPTDPDSFWSGQMQRANQTLIRHQLPVLNASYAQPPEHRLPAR